METLTVTSADGTTIAYDRYGSGPAAVLVGGAFNDRTTVAGLAEALSPHFTVYCPDRRGRGASGDTPPYAVEREVEDLRALVAAAAGEVFLFGHSSGAVLALEATARGLPVRRLAVYEPSYVVGDSRPRPGADVGDRIAALVAADRRDEAVRLFLTECVAVPAEFVDMMRGDPSWAAMETLAHTLPYDVALHGPGQSMPTDRLAAVAVPTLVVDGSDSPEYLRDAARAVAATVPGAGHRTLEGQDHGVLHHPEVLAPVLAAFWS